MPGAPPELLRANLSPSGKYNRAAMPPIRPGRFPQSLVPVNPIRPSRGIFNPTFQPPPKPLPDPRLASPSAGRRGRPAPAGTATPRLTGSGIADATPPRLQGVLSGAMRRFTALESHHGRALAVPASNNRPPASLFTARVKRGRRSARISKGGCVTSRRSIQRQIKCPFSFVVCGANAV
jgi:hypothetical protein